MRCVRQEHPRVVWGIRVLSTTMTKISRFARHVSYLVRNIPRVRNSGDFTDARDENVCWEEFMYVAKSMRHCFILCRRLLEWSKIGFHGVSGRTTKKRNTSERKGESLVFQLWGNWQSLLAWISRDSNAEWRWRLIDSRVTVVRELATIYQLVLRVVLSMNLYTCCKW